MFASANDGDFLGRRGIYFHCVSVEYHIEERLDTQEWWLKS